MYGLQATYLSNKTDQQETIDKNLVTNLSAIDMRIYDLEKDVKNLYQANRLII